MNKPVDQPQLEGIPPPAPSKLIARFSALAVKTVYPFMAKRDIRYYLNGINVRPLAGGGVMLVATDGHRFIVMRDPDGRTEAPIVVRVDKDGLKHAEVPGGTFDVMENGEAKIVDEHGKELFIQPGQSIIDEAGSFPRIENVVTLAGYAEGITGSVNPAYLSAALEIGDVFGGVRFFTRDPDSPLLFVFTGLAALECFGGVMKMHDSFESLPAWFPLRTAPTTLGDV